MTASLINPRTDRRIRAAATASTIAVGITAALISWSGLAALGRSAGMGSLAVLIGVVVDGSIIVGSLHVLHATLTGTSTRLGYGITVVASLLSVWGNVAGSQRVGVTAAVVHAIAPAALIATTHALMAITRHRLAATAAADQAQREALERMQAEQERRTRALEAADARGRERAAVMAALPASARTAVEGGEQVAAIRAVARTLPADASTTDILSAILTAIPGVLPRHIAQAEVVSVSNLHNALSRVRRHLADAAAVDADADAPEQPRLRALASV